MDLSDRSGTFSRSFVREYKEGLRFSSDSSGEVGRFSTEMSSSNVFRKSPAKGPATFSRRVAKSRGRGAYINANGSGGHEVDGYGSKSIASRLMRLMAIVFPSGIAAFYLLDRLNIDFPSWTGWAGLGLLATLLIPHFMVLGAYSKNRKIHGARLSLAILWITLVVMAVFGSISS